MKPLKTCLKSALCFVWLVGTAASAATKNIMVTGFWPPTNEMVRSLSDNPSLNPAGWRGKNWNGSGYDVYAYFPTFAQGDTVGEGDFRVDFAAAYNDFFKYTALLKPVAILSFGQEAGASWVVEVNFPAYFHGIFTSSIPSQIGVMTQYPIPESLKNAGTLHSSFPADALAAAVKRLGITASVNTRSDAGDFLCGFMGYLGAWYHGQHSDPQDSAYNAMSGFIHTDVDVASGTQAVDATLRQMIASLKK